MSSYDSLSLAGLDAPMVLRLDHPSSSSNLSSATNRSCCTSFRTPPKVKGPVLNINVTPLSNHYKAYPSLELLPPVPRVSSFQLSLILDAAAPPAPQTTDRSLSHPQPHHSSRSTANLSHRAVENHFESTRESYQSPEIYDPNNPYIPWPRSIRPLIIPPSSFVTMSHFSHYSRPLSRSGARAPEPAESNTSVYGVGCRIPGYSKLRKMKRDLQFLPRRLHALRTILRKRNRTRTSISPTNLRPSSILSISFTVTSRSSNRSSRSRSSAMSLSRDSLASWFEERNRASIEYTNSRSTRHESMDISEYERRGSWLLDPEASCCIKECSMHHVRSTEHLEVGEGKYFGVSLAAGQEAFRRRRTNSST